MRARSVFGPTLAVALAAVGCREPTQMTYLLTTDVPCERITGVAITVGGSEDFDARPPSTTVPSCASAGQLGSIVTVPLGDKSASMGIKVALGVGRDATECSSSSGTGCIVARRSLSYIPHHRLSLTVPLSAACLGVTCRATETCVAGACTNAEIVDAAACESGCAEEALGKSVALAQAPSPLVCGDMYGLEPGAAWPMQGYCPTRTGRGPRAGAQTNGVRWTAKLPATTSGGISVSARGTLYVPAEDDRLYAVSPRGEVLWSSRAGGRFGVSVGAIGRDGSVYLGSSDGKLDAFAPGGGLRWAFEVGGFPWPSPVVSGQGTVVFGGGAGGTDLLGMGGEGALGFRVKTGGEVLSAPSIGQDGTIYVAGEDQYLYARNPDGSPKWQLFNQEGLQSTAVGPNGWVYFNGKPSICAVEQGTVRWVAPTDGNASTPAIGADGTVYAATASGKLYAFDGATGKERWVTAIEPVEPSNQPILGADGILYVGTLQGNFYAVAPDGAVRWKLATSGKIQAPAAIGADGTTYVASADGTVWAIGP